MAEPAPTRTREIRLAARPHGEPGQEHFETVEVDLPEVGEGEILVRQRWMSVDPYMRGRMNDAASYAEPWRIGEACEGGAVGEVLASRSDRYAVGDLALSNAGWREHAVLPAKATAPVDASAVPEQAYLGVLGMPGLTAWAGLNVVGEFAAGKAVFVSGAAGAVGSLVGQLAKAGGASRVIGSAGGPEKVRHLTEDLGFDVGIDYREGDLPGQLRAAAPDGVDLYFDNVGGEHLEAAIGRLNLHARVVVCGMISQYSATEPTPAPRNLIRLIQTRARIEGMLVADHRDRQQDFLAEVLPLVRDGRIVHRETVREGLDRAVDAFRGVLSGANTGKMLVRL